MIHIYSNKQEYIDQVISRMGKHYEVTLDMKVNHSWVFNLRGLKMGVSNFSNLS